MGIIWGSRKLFARSEHAVRSALRHPLLAGRPVIVRGAYSIVLCGESSVFKLTIDSAAYALAEQQSRWLNPALPATGALHGIVGEIACGVPLLLFEMESLQKLQVGSAARKTCLSIARRLRPIVWDGMTSVERLRHVGALQPNMAIGHALGLLADFLEPRWPAVDLDLHSANFMLRQSTGEAVISDPFMDVGTRTIVLDDYKLGFPDGTRIL